ncbi:unnamed protein product [Ophioblennius macclurei]
MALPLFRGCSRFSPTSSLPLRFLNKTSVLSRSGTPRLPAPLRAYSSNNKVVVVGLPNPFIWFRTRIYYFLIRTYFDKEFSIDEFTEGAKQAFSHVSRLLSQCQFEDLDGLVEKDLVGKLQEKCSLLPSSYKKALSADPDDIMYSTPGDVGIYYDDNGRKFVSILMRFWYLTSAQLPDESMEGTRLFKVSIGEGTEDEETKRLLTAIYEFQREFTKGVPPNWTITRIEHSKLLD